MEVSGQFHAPLPLSLGTEALIPLAGKLDGPHRRSGRSSKEKNIPAPIGNRTSEAQPVAQSLHLASLAPG
jgi:hypothetical protein